MRTYRLLWFCMLSVVVGITIIMRSDHVRATPLIIPMGTMPPLHVVGNRIVDPTGHPVILRGIGIPDVEYTHRFRRGGVVAAIDTITDQTNGWYPHVLRIPVYPESDGILPIDGWINTPTYFTDYLKPAVDHCISKRIYCIIDWHWMHSFAVNNDPSYGIDLAEQQRVDTQTRAFWTTIVQQYGNHPNIIFELFNEPIFPDDWEAWRTTAQPWINLIRNAGANNLILVGSPHWSLHTIRSTAAPLTGQNIAYTVHVYPGHTTLPPWMTIGWTPKQLSQLLGSQTRFWMDAIEQPALTYPLVVTEFGWEPCTRSATFSEECANHPSGGMTASYGIPLKEFLETPSATATTTLPKVAGWTVWVADYCLGPRLFDQTTREALNGQNEQGQFMKSWLFEKRHDYFPTPIPDATITPGLPRTSNPEPYPNQSTDCEYDPLLPAPSFPDPHDEPVYLKASDYDQHEISRIGYRRP